MQKPSPGQPRPPRKNDTNQQVTALSVPTAHHPGQGHLFPVTEREIDGVQMGVLSDGTPYLTLRGLARMCGIDHTSILPLATQWDAELGKPRGRRIAELLATQHHQYSAPFLRTRSSGGEAIACPDSTCMAVLEYYAFEAKQTTNEVAQRNFRFLARQSFRDFIYKGCGYDPAQQLEPVWRNFHDRVSLNFDAVPEGYFSIFKQIADLIVALGEKGLHIHDGFVPDISVGQCWGKYWKSINGDTTYGPRIHYKHNFPEYYPQSASNPQEPCATPKWLWAYFKSGSGKTTYEAADWRLTSTVRPKTRHFLLTSLIMQSPCSASAGSIENQEPA